MQDSSGESATSSMKGAIRLSLALKKGACLCAREKRKLEALRGMREE